MHRVNLADLDHLSHRCLLCKQTIIGVAWACGVNVAVLVLCYGCIVPYSSYTAYASLDAAWAPAQNMDGLF
jgi:hypothetical protein